MKQISDYVKRCRKEQHLTQPELAHKAGVGLRFLRELEQGKQSLRMDKVNQVLAYFGSSCGVNENTAAKQDITKYRLSSLDELVKADDLIIHHSVTFGETYHPHYRIIAKDIFEKKILPRL